IRSEDLVWDGHSLQEDLVKIIKEDNRETNKGELGAFLSYAKVYPSSCLLLVDTYDTLKSGVPNAIRVFKLLNKRGHKPIGIRLDSGDLVYLSQEARHLLDQAGLTDVKIFASNDLDETI